jgi:hypothetical protein
MTGLRTWRLTRLTLLSLLLGSSLVSAQSGSTTSAASSGAASSTASPTSSSPITHTVNVAQVRIGHVQPENFGGFDTDDTQLGRLHIRSRRHISRSRGLHPYVSSKGTAMLSFLLTMHVQNTISSPQTTALFAPNTSILAYPMKILEWTRLDSSLGSNLLILSFRIRQPLQSELMTRTQSSTIAVRRAPASIMAWLGLLTRVRTRHSQYKDN